MSIAREWAKAGHTVVVIASNSNHLTGNRHQAAAFEDRLSDGVRVMRLRTMRYERTASMARVLSWVDFERRLLGASLYELPPPDVIIVSSLSLLSVVSGITLARRYRCPWVFEVRDIWPLTLVEEGGFPRWHPFTVLLAGIERLGYSRAAMVVGTMPNLIAHVRRVVDRPVPVACIPFGFDPTVAQAPRRISPREEGAQTLVVGYAGSIGVSNALETLIECAVPLRDDGRYRFVIAGDGDSRESLMERTRDCDHITWLGRVPRGEVHSVLSECDVLYFAAHRSQVWEYGLSLNKLTDYLLAARPILASYSGFPTILNEAGCGEFVRAADPDALMAALHRFREMSADARAHLGENGRRWLFEHRTWERLAAEYVELIDAVIRRDEDRGL